LQASAALLFDAHAGSGTLTYGRVAADLDRPQVVLGFHAHAKSAVTDDDADARSGALLDDGAPLRGGVLQRPCGSSGLETRNFVSSVAFSFWVL
jgi:hypothetical protein